MDFLKRNKGKSVEPAKWGLPSSPVRQRTRSYLLAIAIGTVALWQLPLGRMLLYPFTLLATWFHEMGHGLASMLLGADFERLVLFADGSGYALSNWSMDAPALFHAVTAAAGLLGPSIAGAAMIVASRSEKATRVLLYGLGAVLLLSTVIWVRSLAGWIVLPALGVGTLLVARFANAGVRRFAIEFLGVQAAISIWRDIGYLFSEGGYVDGRHVQSDTGAIADVLLLPYWFWGGAITLAIAVILWKALEIANRP